MFFFLRHVLELAPLIESPPREPPDSSWLEKVREESKDRSDWSDDRIDLDEGEDVDGERDKGANPESLK